MKPLDPPSERSLSADEFRAALAVIRRFRRRYPAPAQRLAYARRAYRRWTAARP